jgi:LAGLIDADG DNA endonuclease family
MNNNNYLMNEKSLVLWGSNLGSTAGIRYTKYELSIINLPTNIKSIMVGIILSDGHIALNFKGKNAYLILNQSLAKSAYLYYVFSFLSHYCQSYPKLSVSYIKGKPSYILRIATRSMPCITELYYNYYLNKIKIIKPLIYNDLTPIALAHWIMGDGSYNGKGLVLCTDSFKIKEVVLLINVLMIRYNINCTITYQSKKYPRIYIGRKYLIPLQKIVLPFMHKSMFYKLGLCIKRKLAERL